MPLDQLEHYTIACSDMERTRAFYCDVLGLKAGPRPDVGFAGYWLYCGDVPVVHLGHAADINAASRREAGAGTYTGSLDHIAFRGSDVDAMIARLKQHDIPFRENTIAAHRMRQVFARDPDGVLIEMNFREPA